MKKALFLWLFFASLSGYAQTYTDTQLQQHQDSVLRGNSANNVTHPQGRDLLRRLNANKINKVDGASKYDSTQNYTRGSLVFYSGHRWAATDSISMATFPGSSDLWQCEDCADGGGGTDPDLMPFSRKDHFAEDFMANSEDYGGISRFLRADPTSPSGYYIQLRLDSSFVGGGGGGGGGHILKNNATTLTQRATLRILSNDPVGRDSSAIGESLLDLRDYVSRFGTAGSRPISGNFVVDPNGFYQMYAYLPAQAATSYFTLDFGKSSIQSQKTVSGNDLFAEVIVDNFNLTDTDADVTTRIGTTNQTTNVTNAHIDFKQTPLAAKIVFSGQNHFSQPAWRGAQYDTRYLTWAQANADTANDLRIPDVRLVKDAVSAAGGTAGHVLKNNASTLTQRGTLQVLSDVTYMRDSSATTSSILDLRNMLKRNGTPQTRPMGGEFHWTDFLQFINDGSATALSFLSNQLYMSGGANAQHSSSLTFASGDLSFNAFDENPDNSALTITGLLDATPYGHTFTSNYRGYQGAYYDLIQTDSLKKYSLPTTFIWKSYLFDVLDSLGVSGGSASNADSLGSQPASYYASAASVSSKVSNVLSSGNILVGSAGNVATPATMSGDATLSNTGAITIASTLKIKKQQFTATAGQTAFTTSSTITTPIIVVVAGIVADTSHYSTSGTTLTLTTGASVGEVVQIIYL